MRFIPNSIHGILDYLLGLCLVALPWLLRLDGQRVESIVPIALGLILLAYSLLTQYKYGLFKVLPMPMHLALDMLGGAFLAATPWFFAFSHRIWLPYTAIGILEILISLTTKTTLSVFYTADTRH